MKYLVTFGNFKNKNSQLINTFNSFFDRNIKNKKFWQKRYTLETNLKKTKIIEMKSSNILISDVAKSYGLDLIKSGKSFKILCIFHQEKTPSLLLNNSTNTFYCFGCKKSGNIFNFIKYLNSNQSSNKDYRFKNKKVKKIFFNSQSNYSFYIKEKLFFSKLTSSDCLWVLHLAWGFFMNNFYKNKLLKVLVFSRGISVCSARIYGIGYASKKKNTLFKYFKNSGLKVTDIIRSGMVYVKKQENNVLTQLNFKKNGNEDFLDVFRDRIIIPIRNNEGVIVGFGGRLISKIKIAKYINSADSNLFKKKRVLFSEEIISVFSKNLYKTLILTEGYIDSIALFQNGIKFTTASLGTSIGFFQLKRLHLLSKNNHILLYFDSDKAGILASKKIFKDSLQKLIQNHFCISIVHLNISENLKDPDEVVYYKGSKELTQKILNGSLPLTNWFEIIFLKNLKFVLIYFLLRNSLRISDNFLVKEKESFIDKHFFNKLYEHAVRFCLDSEQNNLLLDQNKSLILSKTKMKSLPIILSKERIFFFENEEYDFIRFSQNFEECKNFILLASFLFPIIKDDFIQSSILNEFIFPNYLDKCFNRNLISTIFDCKKSKFSNFFDIIVERNQLSMMNPNYCKSFLITQFSPLKGTSIEMDLWNITLYKNFYCFSNFFLVFKRKKLDIVFNLLLSQINRIGIIFKKKNQPNVNLIILHHRKARIKKIINSMNQKNTS
jgi:DNA primase catalytic core